jgi:hypothetical protein
VLSLIQLATLDVVEVQDEKVVCPHIEYQTGDSIELQYGPT